MRLIIDNIAIATFLMMFFGFITHQIFILSKISKKKGVIVSPLWYVRNRPYEFAGSWLLSSLATVIAFVGYDPANASNVVLSAYLSNVVAIGLGADLLSNKFGRFQQSKIAVTPPCTNNVDDFKTMRRDPDDEIRRD